MLSDEIKNHLCRRLIPFWMKLRDAEYGGYYGWMDRELHVDRQAAKGCILNSRILWFFSNAAMSLGNSVQGGSAEGSYGWDSGTAEAVGGWEISLEEAAAHAYRFLRDRCIDRERGGVYWSVGYRGEPEDTTKHTYNQAFAVYALSSYFRASHNREALELAEELITVIETRCFDVHGYKEALDRDF